MAVSLAAFRAIYPEFDRASDALVQEMLDQADRGTDSGVFGDRIDDAIKWKAAHLIASSPFGRAARLAERDGETVYGRQYQDLVRECAGGFRVV